MSAFSDEVLRVWAAQHLKVEPPRFVSEAVLFFSEGDGGCGCCGDSPHAHLTVTVEGYKRAPRTHVHEIDLLEQLDRFIEEIVELAVTLDDD